jgi:hypothetical protein
MSSNGVYGFYKNGVNKLTYNHSGSYYDELGVEIVNFLKESNIKELNDIFERIILVDEDSVPTSEQIRECEKY